jgi:hypothetical protein
VNGESLELGVQVGEGLEAGTAGEGGEVSCGVEGGG